MGLGHLALFPFHRHLFVGSHFICIGLLPVFTNIADAGCPVAFEQERKNFADEIAVNLAILHILITFSTGVEAFLLAALAYLAP